MNQMPCKYCHRFLEEHLKEGELSPSEPGIKNAENWCFDVGHGANEYNWYYKPCSNLEYLEWCYESKTV